MTFDPDLINTFHQNLRMAQIHSSGGVNENNFSNIMRYMSEAVSCLKDMHPKNEIIPEDLSDVLANESKYKNTKKG